MDHLSHSDDRSFAPLTASLFSPRQPRPINQTINSLSPDAFEPFDALFPSIDFFLDFHDDYTSLSDSSVFNDKDLFLSNGSSSPTVLQSIQHSNVNDQSTAQTSTSTEHTDQPSSSSSTSNIKIEPSQQSDQMSQNLNVSTPGLGLVKSSVRDCRKFVNVTVWNTMLNCVVRRIESAKCQTRIKQEGQSINQSISPQAAADLIYVFGQLFEMMPNNMFEQFLKKLSYTSTPSPTFLDPARTVWISSQPNRPRVSMPHRFKTDWSWSSLHSLRDNPSNINVATLYYERPTAINLYKHDSGFVAVEVGKPRVKPYDNDTEVALSDVDLAVCSLPMVVQVNSAFERLFGFTQSETRAYFMREGMSAMYRFNERDMMQKVHEKSVNGIVEGHCEFSHIIDIKTKYSSPLKTVMTNRLFLNEAGVTIKHMFVWIPLPAGAAIK